MDENKRTMKTRSMTAAKEDARKTAAKEESRMTAAKEAAIAQAEWDAQMDATNIPPPRKFYGYSDTCTGPGCVISGGKSRKLKLSRSRRSRSRRRKSRKMSRSRRRY